MALVSPPGGAVPSSEAASGTASQRRAAALVQQMIAAAGGMERWNSIRDARFIVRQFGYGILPGRPVVSMVTMSFTKDPRPMLRLDIQRGSSVHSSGFDGEEAWVAVDGIPLHKGKDSHGRIRREARHTLLWFTFPFHLVDPSVVVDYVGTSRFMGSEVDVLQVSFRDDSLALNATDIYRYSVNRGTALVSRAEYFANGSGNDRIEVLYGDYRTVNGIVKEHVREILSGETGAIQQRLEIDGLEFDLGLPSSLFHRPPDPLARGDE